MKKILLLFGINLTFILSLLYLTPDQLKIDLRTFLFTKKVKITSFSQYNKIDFLKPYGFLEWREKYYNLTDKRELLKTPINNGTFLDSVKQIVNLFSRNGGPGCGTHSNNLMENFYWVKNGGGCCSDHSQVFLALLLTNGFIAREVHNLKHTFNEVYDRKNKKWIWIDSQFKLVAYNTSGELLNLYEIFEYYQSGKMINFSFFGGKNDAFYGKDVNKTISNSLDGSYWSKAGFSVLFFTNGNNVFRENFLNLKYSFLPREISQALFLALGMRPNYLYFDPLHVKKNTFYKVKIFLISSILILLLGNLLALKINRWSFAKG
jgi:hypothetical protein